MTRFLLVVGIAGLLFSGCLNTAPTVGAPVLLGIPNDQNPDVIWVVRKTTIPAKLSGSHKDVFGLFACYRRPASNPGAPTCYLAKVVWNPEDLQWPGNVHMQGGKIVVEDK